jgi:hypothetical protein
MWANDPTMARRWAKETPKGKKLPKRKKTHGKKRSRKMKPSPRRTVKR